MVTSIEDHFRGLRGKIYQVTSPAAEPYDCIARAAEVTTIWWWPFGDPRKTYWPEGVPREESLEAFRAAFANVGYSACDHAQVEPGYQKVALFADVQGAPLHAARQLSTGRWTSKLGALEDIEHELHDLEGMEYGTVVLIMKRPLGTEEKALK